MKLLGRAKDDPGTEKFLDNFYKPCIEILFKPFSEIPEFKNLAGAQNFAETTHLTLTVDVEPVLRLTREKTNLFVYLCDLLCNFTQQHSFRSHFFILSSNISPRIASLLSSRDKHLRLGTSDCSAAVLSLIISIAAFRFFRICLKLNNGNLIKHFIKNDIFTPIIKLTIQETRRDNLLSSSCLEFFEHMRRVSSTFSENEIR